MRLAALCTKCGEAKPAPLTACPACKFLPETAEDRAAALNCSAVHQLQETLVKMQQQIRAGEKIAAVPPPLPVEHMAKPSVAYVPPAPRVAYDPELGRDPTSEDMAAKARAESRLFRIAMWITAPFGAAAVLSLLFGFFQWRNYQTGRVVPFYYSIVEVIDSLPFGGVLMEYSPYELAFRTSIFKWVPFLIAIALPFWLRSQARKRDIRAESF
jgi:hypothetical protein